MAQKQKKKRLKEVQRERRPDTPSEGRTVSENKFFVPVILCLILLTGAFLLFKNLDNQYLWEDEAETALIGKTILVHGIPLGYDGKNFFSQNEGDEYGKDYMWKWTPWFQFYLVAGSFELLGASTFTARLPFVLFGIGTILLTYFLARSLWMSRRAGLVAALLLVLSVPFLILSRQCRYYSPLAFFATLGLFSYLNFIGGKRFSSIVFVLASTLLFHTHYPYYGILTATVLSHAWIFHRDKLKRLLFLVIVTAVLTLPWAVWVFGLSSKKTGITYLPTLDNAFEYGSYYFIQITKYVFPIPMIAITLFAMLFKKKSERGWDSNLVRRNLILLLLFIGLTFFTIACVLPYLFFRYLTPLIPLCCIIMALGVESCMRWHAVAGVAALLLFAYVQPLPDYLYEITHDYQGPIKGIVTYLNQHARKDETVAMTYGDLPVKFYTGMRVIGGLTGEDLAPAREADWVILRKYVLCQTDWQVRKYLVENLPWHAFQKMTIDYPDLPWENRETPSEHHYRTVTNEDKVAIYRRIK